MKMDELRSFAAGLDVAQRDSTTGQQRAKGQLLDAWQLCALPPTQRHGVAFENKPHNSATPQLGIDGLFISMALRTFPT